MDALAPEGILPSPNIPHVLSLHAWMPIKTHARWERQAYISRTHTLLYNTKTDIQKHVCELMDYTVARMFAHLCSYERFLLPCVVFSRMEVCSVKLTQMPQELYVVKAESAPVQQAVQLEKMWCRWVSVALSNRCVEPRWCLCFSSTPRFLIVSHVKPKGNVDLLF